MRFAKCSLHPHDARVSDDLKCLILTGDDFGLSAEVNAAVARYHAAGALTQASLMVAESHAGPAAVLARQTPNLCVGLHLSLCSGSATHVSPLTDARGRFVQSPARAGWRYFFNRRLRSALRDEIRRQFEKFRAFGLPPTYWDGHTHLHLHPTVLRLTLPIAREFGFRFMRLVREPGLPALIPWIFAGLSAAALPTLRAGKIRVADRVFGLRATGRMTEHAVKGIVGNLPCGISELYYHPGGEPALPSPERLADMVHGLPLASARTLDPSIPPVSSGRAPTT